MSVNMLQLAEELWASELVKEIKIGKLKEGVKCVLMEACT